jgi:hypothetical protein
VVDEDIALGHTDLEELGEGMDGTDYTEGHVSAAWVVGDRIEDSHKANFGSDTMLDMDNHMPAAVDMELMVMATAVMCVRAQSQITFVEQERLLEAEVEAEVELLCWRLVEEYSTAAGTLCTLEAWVAA